MNNGAVALIDALGFRGIWGRHSPDGVLRSLKEMQQWMEQRVQDQFKTQPAFQCKIAFLSDTIAASMSVDAPSEHQAALNVIYLADTISWILERTLRSSIPLAYRGAIAVGSYEVSPHFLIGQAVDDAASAYELANAAVIWLTPAARNHVAGWLSNQPRNTHLVKFGVPLKGGDSFDTYTVSPLEQARDNADANNLSLTLLSTFVGSSIDVAMKRQNTIRHLRECYTWRGFAWPRELS